MLLEEETTKNLEKNLSDLKEKYAQVQAMHLNMNIARGFPCREQLDANSELFHLVDETNCFSEDGTDCRQYGVKEGLPEAKRLFSDLIGIPKENIVIGGESSFSLIYNEMLRLYVFGFPGCRPWSEQKMARKLKWLCPVPGYDCHFSITEALGFEMIPIPIKEDGPDMDLVEQYANKDSAVKGIWCVPQYSNPTGDTYSDETVERLAHLQPAADDFVIVWDNAYCVHHLFEKHVVKDIWKETEKSKMQDHLIVFASTAKITFPGSAISMIAAGDRLIQDIKDHLYLQLFSHDKINQLRHVRFLRNRKHIEELMSRNAAFLRPKFDLVEKILKEHQIYDDIYTFEKPDGGYFITAYTHKGCARRTLGMTEKAGVIIWFPGAAYPYHRDPDDAHVRLSPTFPDMETLKTAISLFAVCAGIAGIEKELEARKKR